MTFNKMIFPKNLRLKLNKNLLPAGNKTAPFRERIETLLSTLKEYTFSNSKIRVLDEHPDKISQGNLTVEKALPKETYYSEQRQRTKEAQGTDLAMKGIINHIEELGNKTNIKIEKSQELTQLWKDYIHSLDAYIKSKNLSKYLKWAACITTIGLFVFKMGLARKIPEFFFSALSNISIPSAQTMGNHLQSAGSHVKPNESTLNALMETPLTPLMILTGVGGLTITMGILKATLWVLRKR
jgi:hypothetical protein